MAGEIYVARGASCVYLRVDGQGNMNNALCAKEFADRMIGDGYTRFVVDLAACTGMDSTFMGTLLAVSLTTNRGGRRGVTVINASPKNRDLLDGIGLTAILDVRPGKTVLPPLQVSHLAAQSKDPRERLRLIRAVHEQLVRLDKKNEAQFGPFLATLNTDAGKA